MTEFRIGMKTSEVLRHVQSQNSKATDTTKQLIFNFCQNDQDGKISNCNELAILNAWASGSEKVEMPKPDKVAQEANVNGVNTSYIADKENNLFTTFETGIVSTGPWHGENRNQTDILQDLDNDGYADSRMIVNGSAIQGKEEIEMVDANLNGIPDDKE